MTDPDHPPQKSKNQTAYRARSAARLYAVQALFQMEASGQGLATIKSEFETHRFGAQMDGDTYEEGDIDLFRDIVEAAVSHQARIDQHTDATLVDKWPIARIDPTLRAIFRGAGAEFILGKAPGKVVISEYVDLAGSFFPDGKEPRFTNAVLDQLMQDLTS